MRALLVAAVAVSGAACERPAVTLWVDGFSPDDVTYDVRELGPLDEAALGALAKDRAVDRVLRVPPGTCSGPCRVSEVSVYVANRTSSPLAPPVIRLDAPAGRVPRLPLAGQAAQIDPGRTSRLRFIVERWPEEAAITATLSSSVAIDARNPLSDMRRSEAAHVGDR